MTKLIVPGQGILFMKVGTHAQEDLESIIARKKKEIDDEGFALWGYGGNTCHPTTMVQPFAEEHAKNGGSILLCMQPMDSKHRAEQVRATEYSADSINWKAIPSGINALGSRFALFIKSLQEDDFELPLSGTEVAVGRSAGRLGHQYLKGQVDKACLNVRDTAAKLNDEEQEKKVRIGLVAELCEPYAVFLRAA